jgi:hypothetical protein
MPTYVARYIHHHVDDHVDGDHGHDDDVRGCGSVQEMTRQVESAMSTSFERQTREW